MSRWYCDKHRHLDENPHRVRTLFQGKKCHVLDCNEILTIKLESEEK